VISTLAKKIDTLYNDVNP